MKKDTDGISWWRQSSLELDCADLNLFHILQIKSELISVLLVKGNVSVTLLNHPHTPGSHQEIQPYSGRAIMGRLKSRLQIYTGFNAPT